MPQFYEIINNNKHKQPIIRQPASKPKFEAASIQKDFISKFTGARTTEKKKKKIIC